MNWAVTVLHTNCYDEASKTFRGKSEITTLGLSKAEAQTLEKRLHEEHRVWHDAHRERSRVTCRIDRQQSH